MTKRGILLWACPLQFSITIMLEVLHDSAAGTPGTARMHRALWRRVRDAFTVDKRYLGVQVQIRSNIVREQTELSLHAGAQGLHALPYRNTNEPLTDIVLFLRVWDLHHLGWPVTPAQQGGIPCVHLHPTTQRSVLFKLLHVVADQPSATSDKRVAVLQLGTQGASFFHIASPAIGRPAQ